MKLPLMDPLSKISAYQILLRTGLNNYKNVLKSYILLSQQNFSLLKKAENHQMSIIKVAKNDN